MPFPPNRNPYVALDGRARYLLSERRIAVAAYVRWVNDASGSGGSGDSEGAAGGRRWFGAPCGCPDARCVGAHHGAGEPCPCMRAQIDAFLASRTQATGRQTRQTQTQTRPQSQEAQR